MAKVKAHRRVPWDKRVHLGNPTQKGEQVGEKTFGVICQRERVFPKSLAKPRSGGETPSRAAPSCPLRRSRADNVLSDKDVTQPLTLTLSHKGRGDGYRGRLRSANRPYSTPSIDPKPYPPRGEGIIYPGAMRSAYCTLRLSRKGGGDGYRGRLRFANRPYTLIAPYSTLQIAPSVVSAWGHGQSPGG